MDDAISRNSDEFKQLVTSLETAIDAIGSVSAHLRPTLLGERYLTGEEVCRVFHLSKRTLQDYRDHWTIPYTTIGGKILYPESELTALLEQNHVAAREE